MSDVVGRILTVMLMFIFENENDDYYDREVELKHCVYYSFAAVCIFSSVFTI